MKKIFLFCFGLLVSLVSLHSCEKDLLCEVSVRCDGQGTVAISGYIDNSVSVPLNSEIEVVATPNVNSRFDGWYDGESNNLLSKEKNFVFRVSDDIVLVAKFRDCVDLGLPSGLKWATCNVGASVPEEFGGYYAWGETEEKINDGKEDIDSNGIFYDVARVKWGGNWRMPTSDEFQELIDCCTWEWVAINGVEGYKVTGPNGNNIFLPAAGSCGIEGVRKPAGYYLSSSLDEEYSCRANCLTFNKLVYSNYSYYRSCGFSIRPVCY